MGSVFRSLLILGAGLALTGCVTVSPSDVQNAKANNIPVVITKFSPSRPNSAGGVDVKAYLSNTSSQPIKYVVYTTIPFNEVGDKVRSKIGRKSVAMLRDTGPIKPNSGSSGFWSNIWYNYSISCLEITDVDVIFFDDSRQSFSGTELPKILASGFDNSCSYK